MPPDRDIEFIIDLLPRTPPITKRLYRMPVNELVELKKQIAELQSKGLVTPLVSLLLLQCSYSAWMKYKFGLV
jgi:hypothetical protein